MAGRGDMVLRNNKVQGRPPPQFQHPRLGAGGNEPALGKGAFYRNVAGGWGGSSLVNSHPTESQLSLPEEHMGGNQRKPTGRAGGWETSPAKCSGHRRLGCHGGGLRIPSTPAPAASQASATI